MLIKRIKSISIQKKATVSYLLASFFTQGINFITIPIYTRLLTTSDMGIVTTFTSWYAIIYAIGTLSLTAGSMSIAMVEFENNRNQYQSVCLMLSTISATIFLLFYILFDIKLSKISLFSMPIMLVLCLLLFFNPALDSWYLRERYEYKYKAVLCVSIAVSVLSAAVPISCISIARKYHKGNLADIRIIAQYSMVIIIGIFLYIYIMKKGKCIYDKRMIKFALSLSLPLIVHTLAKNILDTSDRLMIANMCGNSAAGIYGTVYSISMIALILWSAINNAVVPVVFEKLKEKEYKYVENLTIKILILFSMGSVLVTLIAPEILFILTTPEYYSAVHMIPAIATGIYFTAVYGIYGNMLLFAKKSLQIMFATSGAAIINIILNYFFIRQYGYMAAAYTTFISFAMLAFMQGKMQLRIYKEEVVSTKYVVGISVITMCSCLMCNFFYEYFWIRYIMIAIMIIILLFTKNYWKSIFRH
ncbi:lipopolysaccharide biosynthesis protein [Blautia obeum]|uniref:lipopolysaccharide biosynthesis protein n=1 Tax=Blautia obeum TaxID=40520 RepID=UPI001570BE81|nr:oligosaccharide flippase family protein [Blautia obeum]